MYDRFLLRFLIATALSILYILSDQAGTAIRSVRPSVTSRIHEKAHMASNKLEESRRRGDLQVVGMDQVGFLRFKTNGKYCLGTANLNSCTAVTIVSRNAAVLAHIAPRPSSENKDEATGDNYVKAKMKEVTSLLEKHQSDFNNQAPGGVVVYAVYNGKVALEDQIKIIGAHLKALKLPVKTVPYKVLEAGDSRSPGKGTVLVDARGKTPAVWVEDNLVGQVKGAGSAATGSSKAESSAAGSAK